MEAPQQVTKPRAWALASWSTAAGELDLRARPLVVAVVNATPDSFSDRGEDRSPAAAAARVQERIAAGADLIEVGGESNVSTAPRSRRRRRSGGSCRS